MLERKRGERNFEQLLVERGRRASTVSDAHVFARDVSAFVDACAEEGLLDLWRSFRRRARLPWPHSQAAYRRTFFAERALKPCDPWISLFTRDFVGYRRRTSAEDTLCVDRTSLQQANDVERIEVPIGTGRT